MDNRDQLTSAKMVCYSWLAAATGLLLALLVVAFGQGVGALLGGCSWIGITVPLHQQVWALVNQPSMIFSRQMAASGYWLGGTIAALLVALLVVPVLPRSRSIAAELLAVQIAWGCVVVGGGWMVLLDPRDGHLSRWLLLHDLSKHLVWLAPVVAMVVALIPTVRLLALARGVQSQLGRGSRLVLVLLHLAAPTLVWVGLGSLLVVAARGSLPVPAIIAALLPLVSALALAHRSVPRAFAQRLEELDGGSFAWVAVLLLLLAATVLLAGRPLPDGGATGVLWQVKRATNNVRPWVHEVSLVNQTPGVGSEER